MKILQFGLSCLNKFILRLFWTNSFSRNMFTISIFKANGSCKFRSKERFGNNFLSCFYWMFIQCNQRIRLVRCLLNMNYLLNISQSGKWYSGRFLACYIIVYFLLLRIMRRDLQLIAPDDHGHRILPTPVAFYKSIYPPSERFRPYPELPYRKGTFTNILRHR